MKITFKFFSVLTAFVFLNQATFAQSFCLQIANNDQLGSFDNKTITFPLSSLLANDTENLNLASFTQPASGNLSYDATTQLFTFTPYSTSWSGDVSFTYSLAKEPETRLGAPFIVNGEEHYYEQIQVQPNITWQNAMMMAAAKSYNGKKGYLATVTSAAENEHIRGILTTVQLGPRTWLGGSDAAEEGTFRWVTGPEANMPLTAYSNWVPGELNNVGEEDYLSMNTSGLWNDLSNEGNAAAGYAPNVFMVEYGSSENCALGLQATASFNVNAPNNPDPTCNLALNTMALEMINTNPLLLVNALQNGTASLDQLVIGGTAPFTYNLTTVVAGDFTQNMPGLYTLAVKDAKGCSGMVTVYLGTVQNPIALVLSPTYVSMAGANDGAVDLTVVGLMGPYTYKWSNGATTQDINQLAAGVYTVMVTDNAGTTVSAPVLVGPESAGVASLKDQLATEMNRLEVQETGLAVYPNPVKASSTVAFKAATDGSYRVELYDLRGNLLQRVSSGSARQNQLISLNLEAGTFKNGLYMLKVITDNNVTTKRLIIDN